VRANVLIKDANKNTSFFLNFKILPKLLEKVGMNTFNSFCEAGIILISKIRQMIIRKDNYIQTSIFYEYGHEDLRQDTTRPGWWNGSGGRAPA
jgi:hypothetical protein